MNFRDDQRAVTVQVGFILLFGVLILSLSMYQVQVVPADNEQVEFDHNQRVQQDMVDTRNAILRSASTATMQPVSVSLGARYPNRVFFVNPPPASGRLSTTEPVADGITIENARAVDAESADYWTGTDAREFETRSLEYTPDYTQYQSPPTTVYEQSVVYNRFDNEASLPQSGQTLVNGKRLSLVALDGELSAERIGSESLDVHPVSASTRTTTVTSEGEPIELSLATGLSEDQWEELLADEEYVTDVSVEEGVLTITLKEDESYSLRMSKVGVGSNVGETEAAYVTDVEGDDATVQTGTTQTLVAEVRDEFGNPVVGEDVTAEVTSGEGSVSFPEGTTTDSEGQVRVVYEAPNQSSQNEVEVQVGYGDEAAEYATFDLTLANGDGTGSDTGGNGGSGLPGQNTKLRVDDLTGLNGNEPRLVVSYDVGEVNDSFERVEIDIAAADGNPSTTAFRKDSPRGSVRYEPGYGTDEEFTITVRTIYRTGGDDVVGSVRTFTDTADGRSPTEKNADLSRSGQGGDLSISVEDRSNTQNNRVDYRVDYNARGNADFSKAEVAWVSQSSNAPTATETLNNPRGNNVRYSAGFGTGAEYRIGVLVYGDDGAVVDTAFVTDTADGEDP
ncbi:hypothetical protein AUR64_17495 [Haloprofundus marisrubri]|uniref:Big-1 domain-containing protein n=1 Tax=Haloprofundus marisrubri TaxID=1514971 RepID=A0A0W1R4Z7_9EURY|nr:hypothetical protein [Haloprofundus marisrubri]KTG08478.1 hypothetical protein AUR64_17495 [Haloprofundus marisrubri]